MISSLSVLSSNKNYAVHFVDTENELLQQISVLKNPLFIIDQNLLLIYSEFIQKIKLSGSIHEMSVLEENKTLQSVESILKFFQKENANRSTTVVAIGGGILQDVASFAAHIFNRGLDTVLIPTTLLSMCDSCIGGKCGVNYDGYKNQIGAFHPPLKVLIWPGFLASLPVSDIRSGCGEILKYMLLKGKEDYEKFKSILLEGEFSSENWMYYIYEGLKIKKQFVERDEFDKEDRKILNYGHTFGHAIERATNYTIPHGIAVSKGIDIVNFIAWKLGVLSEEIFLDVHLFVQKCFPCVLGAKIMAEELIENVKKDKKNLNGRLDLVVMKDFGLSKIESINTNDTLMDLVSDYLSLTEYQDLKK